MRVSTAWESNLSPAVGYRTWSGGGESPASWRQELDSFLLTLQEDENRESGCETSWEAPVSSWARRRDHLLGPNLTL